jgi:hypothetical protein
MQNETKNQGLQAFENLLFLKTKCGRGIFEQALIFSVLLSFHFNYNFKNLNVVYKRRVRNGNKEKQNQ